MFKKVIDTYNNMDVKIHIILKHGLKFCTILCIVSVIMLLTYNILFSAPLICAFTIDGIKRQVN